MARAAAVKFALTSYLFAAMLTGPAVAVAREATDPRVDGGSATIAVAALPRQGRETFELIRQGGPFPHDKDGSVFGNRERSSRLPGAATGANTP
jgi:ribonuclease T1